MRISDWSSDVCSSDLLVPLDFHIGIDLVLGEHIALEQELVIGPQCFKRLAQAAAHGGHLGQFCRGQIIEVLVHGFTRMDLVLDPVRSEEHTSELQSLMRISYAVFCLKKKNTTK